MQFVVEMPPKRVSGSLDIQNFLWPDAAPPRGLLALMQFSAEMPPKRVSGSLDIQNFLGEAPHILPAVLARRRLYSCLRRP